MVETYSSTMHRYDLNLMDEMKSLLIVADKLQYIDGFEKELIKVSKKLESYFKNVKVVNGYKTFNCVRYYPNGLIKFSKGSKYCPNDIMIKASPYEVEKKVVKKSVSYRKACDKSKLFYLQIMHAQNKLKIVDNKIKVLGYECLTFKHLNKLIEEYKKLNIDENYKSLYNNEDDKFFKVTGLRDLIDTEFESIKKIIFKSSDFGYSYYYRKLEILKKDGVEYILKYNKIPTSEMIYTLNIDKTHNFENFHKELKSLAEKDEYIKEFLTAIQAI